MDYELLALIAVMVGAVLVAIKLQLWWWPGRPGYEYQRVFSAAAAGLLFTVAGAIGWNMSRRQRFFEGTSWVDGPIWWQIGVGVALLLLAGFWARRVPPRPSPR